MTIIVPHQFLIVFADILGNWSAWKIWFNIGIMIEVLINVLGSDGVFENIWMFIHYSDEDDRFVHKKQPF